MSPEEIQREKQVIWEALITDLVKLKVLVSILPGIGVADADSNWILREKLWDISHHAFETQGHIDMLRYWDEIASGDRKHWTELERVDAKQNLLVSRKEKRTPISTADALDLV